MTTRRKDSFSRKEIYQFVIAYCHSPLFDSLEDCADSYGISKQMAKRLIYTAIEECIVEDTVVDILCQKAYQSAFHHACKDGIHQAPSSTYSKYEQLKKARNSFCFSDEKTLEVTMLYISSPLNKKRFCEENAMTKALFDRTLKIAIIHQLISDDMVDELWQKSLFSSSNEKAVNTLFEKLKLARAQYQG